jgi:hypothetical protein
MHTGAVGRLELITQVSGHASIAAAARAIYGGRDSALCQKARKIETAAGFTIIDRSAIPLTPLRPGAGFSPKHSRSSELPGSRPASPGSRAAEDVRQL